MGDIAVAEPSNELKKQAKGLLYVSRISALLIIIDTAMFYVWSGGYAGFGALFCCGAELVLRIVSLLIILVSLILCNCLNPRFSITTSRLS